MSTISIIIPTFNMRGQLRNCLSHIAEQTHVPDEVIVVDDGSTEGTVEAVGARQIITSTNISFISIRQEHEGASAARNRGFSMSKGDYVMFLDADVVLKKHALRRLSEALIQNSKTMNQNFKIGYSYSAFRWGWKKFSSFPFDENRLTRMPYIHTTSLISRVALPEKPFDENLKRLQDWDLYLTLCERGVAGVYVPEILFAVETHGTMSRWLPSVLYQIPLEKFGVKIASLEKYRDAERIVRIKHGLLSS